jgi:hypothetical protein
MAHFARRAADEGNDALLVVGAEHADELAGILASADDDTGGSGMRGEEGARDEELYGGGGGGGRGGDGGVFFHQEQQVIDELLGAGKGGSGSGTTKKVHLVGVDMGVEMEVELEKRAALAAMLVSTQTFPPHAALPPAEELGEEARAIVARVYPKYRQAFGARMAEAQEKAREGVGVGGEGGGGEDGAAAGGWDPSVAQHTPGQVTRVHGLANLAEFCRDVA